MASLPKLLSHWRAEPTIGGNIVHWQSLPQKEADYLPFPENLHTSLTQALKAQGIEALYSHQAAAWEHARLGENLVVVTGTASGKTLAYNLPVLDRLIRVPEGRALYLFPTKALSQDQKNELDQLNHHLPQELRIPPAPYAGDTTQAARPSPGHRRWCPGPPG